jgi:hypothetical protein
MTHEAFDSGKERKELSPEEAVVFNDLLQTFIGREAAKSLGDDEARQNTINAWVNDNAARYEAAFEELLEEKPELVRSQNFANQEAAIKFIEERI